MSEKTCFIDKEKRKILLSGEMDNESIGEIEWALIQIITEDDQNDRKEKDFERKPIVIYINSPGGWVYDTWGLIDIIQHSKTPVHTVCTGYAMSSAFKLLIAGHKRYCYPHSTLMYHQFSVEHMGNTRRLSMTCRKKSDFLRYPISMFCSIRNLQRSC